VAIAAIRVDGVPIRLDDARLSSGWLPPESTWRWTTGDAGLLVAGARALMFDIAMTGTYWKARPRARRTDPACMLRSA
jgi:hypothetical protein